MSSGISPTAARTRKMLQERRQSCTCVGAAADVQRRASGGGLPVTQTSACSETASAVHLCFIDKNDISDGKHEQQCSFLSADV